MKANDLLPSTGPDHPTAQHEFRVYAHAAGHQLFAQAFPRTWSLLGKS